MPASYVPDNYNRYMPVTGFTGMVGGRLSVDTSGVVSLYIASGTGNWVSLDGVTFDMGY